MNEPPPNDWTTHRSRHFLLLYQPGGVASRDISAISSRLEVFRSGFQQALGLATEEQQPTTIALLEPGLADETPPEADLKVLYQCDSPGKGFEVPLVRLWLQRKVRPAGRTPDFLVDGITGYVDEETHELDRPQVGAKILEQIESDESISIANFLALHDEGTTLYFLVATSFVDFLIRAFGSDRLIDLVGRIHPARPDEATTEVYGVPLADLERAWVLSLEESRPAARGLLPLLSYLFSRTIPRRKQTLGLLAAMLIQISLAACLPFLEKILFDDALQNRNPKLLFVVLVLLGVGFLIKSIAGLYQDYTAARIGARAMNDLRYEMFGRLQRLSMDFFGRTRPGDITTRFSSDLPVLEEAMVTSFPWGIYYTATFLVSGALLFTIDWRLALLTVAISPVIDLGIRTLGPRAAQAAYQSRQADARIAGEVSETIAAQRVIKIFGLEEALLGRFDRALEQRIRTAIRAKFLSHLTGRLSLLSLLFVELLVIGIGSYFVLRGWQTIGSLIAFASLLLNMSLASSGLAHLIPQLLLATGAHRRILEFQTETPTFADRHGARPLARVEQGIRFRNVSFSYTGDRIDLEEVNLEIPVGSSVAFVGPTGSGKSTILSLITRLYDPLAGSIEVDGVDLRNVTIASLRQQIGVVFQDVFLFDGSIRENIRSSRPTATDAEVEEAAEAAEIHHQILRLPAGYDTQIGDRGASLSGGQRQRISIARALLRNPALLILDEATSALDVSTERAVQATFRRLAAQRTVMAVTHRLSSVTEFDRIFVLEDGRLADQGSHQELLSREGLYHRLWNDQSGFVLSENGRRATVDAERVARLPLLANLAKPALARVANRFTSEFFETGKNICRIGEPGDKFYLIVRGAVEVIHEGPSGIEKRLAIRRDGDHFGEVSLLHEIPRTATVRSLIDTLLVSLDREQFKNLLSIDPSIRDSLEHEIATRRVPVLQKPIS